MVLCGRRLQPAEPDPLLRSFDMRPLIVALFFIVGCATADPVAKKTESAAMTITGIVTTEGVECPAVRGDDKKLYTIVGKGREKLKPGVRVKITGAVAEMSTCMQGITIEATE